MSAFNYAIFGKSPEMKRFQRVGSIDHEMCFVDKAIYAYGWATRQEATDAMNKTFNDLLEKGWAFEVRAF
jgi:hypothetical protein